MRASVFCICRPPLPHIYPNQQNELQMRKGEGQQRNARVVIGSWIFTCHVTAYLKLTGYHNRQIGRLPELTGI